ncbi:MAG: FKBP-type peptidyl-prolyl cis-trans isomerase [Bacteroidia bacterium]|nr:FKBP-type peptidyl-prolyl cis-trans isomerase [Bacteroidia bacterium]
MNKRLLILAGVLAGLMACRQEQHRQPAEAELKKRMENVNRILVEDESKTITDFITRHQFRMKDTGTGLRYEVIREGTGPVPGPKAEVTIVYSLYTLDGTQVYPADTLHPHVFRLGAAQHLKGVEEAVQLVKEGSRVRLVLPSHLAFGMLGDQDKIPGATPVYLDLELKKVNP